MSAQRRHPALPDQADHKVAFMPECQDTTATPSGSPAALVQDCRNLLAAKHTLLGTTGSLNWGAGVDINDLGPRGGQKRTGYGGISPTGKD